MRSVNAVTKVQSTTIYATEPTALGSCAMMCVCVRVLESYVDARLRSNR